MPVRNPLFTAKSADKRQANHIVHSLADIDDGWMEFMEVTIPWSRKLKWLTYMLWGGAVLLAFEHIWHGEVVPWFPFLTAMSDPADAAEMFHEMATVGVAMAGLITVVWIAMCIAASAIAKRPAKAPKQKTAI